MTRGWDRARLARLAARLVVPVVGVLVLGVWSLYVHVLVWLLAAWLVSCVVVAVWLRRSPPD
jgi:hypothetical protein